MTRLINPEGASYSYSQDDAAPAFDAEVLVPGATKRRIVYGYFLLNGGVASPALINAQVEDASGSGVFDIVTEGRAPEATGEFRLPYYFVVEGGRKYKFAQPSAGEAATIARYNFVDET